MSPTRRTEDADPTWRGLYVLGAAASVLSLAGTAADIALSATPGWEPSTVPSSVTAWFGQLQTNSLLGLRNLDLLNMCLSVIALPMYLALYGVHRRTNPGWAVGALVFTAVGTGVLVTNNAALSMLELSHQYAAATTDAQRLALEGAGQALLSKGAHGSMGAFAGFLLGGVGTLLMAVTMLGGLIFSRWSALTGLIGIGLLLLYVVSTTFHIGPEGMRWALALPGGLLIIAWNVSVARRLIQLSQKARQRLEGKPAPEALPPEPRSRARSSP